MATYLRDLTVRLAGGVAELPPAVRARHAAYLKSAQRSDGGFAGRAGESDLYYTGFALRSLAVLGELEGDLAEQSARFLRRHLQNHISIVDLVSPGQHELARVAKDAAAGAVLLLSIAAVAIGLLILGSPLYRQLLEVFGTYGV